MNTEMKMKAIQNMMNNLNKISPHYDYEWEINATLDTCLYHLSLLLGGEIDCPAEKNEEEKVVMKYQLDADGNRVGDGVSVPNTFEPHPSYVKRSSLNLEDGKWVLEVEEEDSEDEGEYENDVLVKNGCGLCTMCDEWVQMNRFVGAKMDDTDFVVSQPCFLCRSK